MLETKFKIAFLLAVLFFTSLPLIGILSGTSRTPKEERPAAASSGRDAVGSGEPAVTANEQPMGEGMVVIPAGPFIRGTEMGGFDERPQRTIYLSAYAIDRFEVTNHQYMQFVSAVQYRKPGPPSRYAKDLARIRGADQPIVYVSWGDARRYCQWRGKRLPSEAEWEKAMRGADGRLWPWGHANEPAAANLGRTTDGFDATAPVGSFPEDISPFGVADGVGNVMEWVADWYGETYYRDGSNRDPQGPSRGVFKVLRGGGYTSTGSDIRITSRSKMVPDFRDETIGFRCAVSMGPEGAKSGAENL